MARVEKRFVCSDCGAARPRWAGRCDACGAWNSLSEELPREAPPRGLGGGKGRVIDFQPLDGPGGVLTRRPCGIGEIDRGRGRRLRAGLGGPAGGRSGHRQVHLAPAGRGRADRRRQPRRLHLGRRGSGADPHARRPARPRWRADQAGGGHRRARHCDQPGGGVAARHGGDRFDPDHVPRQPGFGTGDGRPGAGARRRS